MSSSAACNCDQSRPLVLSPGAREKLERLRLEAVRSSREWAYRGRDREVAEWAEVAMLMGRVAS